MANETTTTEVNATVHYKDAAGNVVKIYPQTKAENVTDLEEYINNKTDKVSKIILSSSNWKESGTTEEPLYTQTVTVTGISTIETPLAIHIIPAEENVDAYTEAGIYASDQTTNKIIFTAQSLPFTNFIVYVIIKNLQVI